VGEPLLEIEPESSDESDDRGPKDDGYREQDEVQCSRIDIVKTEVKGETDTEMATEPKIEPATEPDNPVADAMDTTFADPGGNEPLNSTAEVEGDFEPNPEVKEEKQPQAAMMTDELAGAFAEKQPYLLVDTGATGNLVHSSWLEGCDEALRAVADINPQRRRSYRFASGSSAICSSEATFNTFVGRVVFDVLESEHGTPPPPLLGMRFLRDVKANLCLLTNTLQLPQGKVLKLMQLQNGHLALKSADFFANNDL
jgi:hypothetical protein